MNLMNYHALFVNFDKTSKILNCRLLQIIGGALWVKSKLKLKNYSQLSAAGHVKFICRVRKTFQQTNLPVIRWVSCDGSWHWPQ